MSHVADGENALASAVLPPLDSSLPEGLALGALCLLVLGTVGSGLALGILLTQFERAASGIYAIGGCCTVARVKA